MFKLSKFRLKNRRQKMAIAFFLCYKERWFSAKEVKQMVFKGDRINESSILKLLTELPMLESQSTLRWINNGRRRLWVFRWDENYGSTKAIEIITTKASAKNGQG